MLSLDFNSAAYQSILAGGGNQWETTPLASTWNARRSLNRLDGLTVVAVLLLQCSPSFVVEWQRTLEHRSWLNGPVEIGAVRWSRLPGKVDAVLVVRRQRLAWARFALVGGRLLNSGGYNDVYRVR